MGELSLEITFEGRRVRMVGTPERPEWVAKDVCRVLGLTTHNAGQGVPDDEKGHCAVVTLGGPQEVTTVREPGLYRLISRSRKPSAQRFQQWLFGKVLPCIRRFGCYPEPAEQPVLPASTNSSTAVLAALAAISTAVTALHSDLQSIKARVDQNTTDVQELKRAQLVAPPQQRALPPAPDIIAEASYGSLTVHRVKTYGSATRTLVGLCFRDFFDQADTRLHVHLRPTQRNGRLLRDTIDGHGDRAREIYSLACELFPLPPTNGGDRLISH